MLVGTGSVNVRVKIELACEPARFFWSVATETLTLVSVLSCAFFVTSVVLYRFDCNLSPLFDGSAMFFRRPVVSTLFKMSPQKIEVDFLWKALFIWNE